MTITLSKRNSSIQSDPGVSPGHEKPDVADTPRKERSEGIGAEPGVNPRQRRALEQFGNFKQECKIEVVEYSNDDVQSRSFGNHSFVNLLDSEEGHGGLESMKEREGVRWINIAGISWDVISAVALKYEFHSLALEDVLSEQGHSQSKADYYHNHMFLRVLCHKLAKESDSFTQSHPPYYMEEDSPDYLNMISAKRFPYSMQNRLTRLPTIKKVDEESRTPSINERIKNFMPGLSGFRSDTQQKQMLRIHALTKGDRVNIRHEPLFIFLMREESTVITIHPTPSFKLTEPIKERLQETDSLLRLHEDASILVEAFLDLIVDRILEMMDKYQDKIHTLEHDILLNPDMNAVRSLHILSGDLIMHKRTLEPIKNMIYGLRRYDTDRTAAVMAAYHKSLRHHRSRLGTAGTGTGSGARDAGNSSRRNRNPGTASATPVMRRSSDDLTASGQVVHDDFDAAMPEQPDPEEHDHDGYLSYTAKTYMADVYDHMLFVIASLDLLSGISENLINYAFNVASYDMNQTMRRLTAATIIFLPLTFLTGYFGQNFDFMWSVKNQSDLIFWIIALPVMCIYLPMVFFSEIRRGIGHVQRRMAVDRVVRPKRRTGGMGRS